MANKKRPNGGQQSVRKPPVTREEPAPPPTAAEPAKVEEPATGTAATEAPQEEPKARKSARFCVINGCTRLRLTADNIKTDKCGAHFASRRGG